MKFAAFDVETRGLWGDFYAAAIVTETDHVFTTSLSDYVGYLERFARDSYTLIAHNAEYDIGASLWQAHQSVDIHYYSGQFNRAYWRYDSTRKPVEIWDSLNLTGGVELAELGKSIGLTKYPTPQFLLGKSADQYQWKCELHNVWECIECYNVRDAEIVHKFVSELAFWVESQGLQLKRTLGGNAVALWNVLDRGKSQTLKAPLIKEMARAAYHAARVELWKPGIHRDIYTADYKSYYLSLLRDTPMPDISTLRYVKNPKEFDHLGWKGVAEVTISIPKRYVCPLPIKMPDGHVYFPWGEFRGHWTIQEINAAIQRGASLKVVHRVAYTDKTVQPFTMFTAVLAALRSAYENKNDAREFTAKTLANSLPGRLGMREEQESAIYKVREGFLEDAEVFGNDVNWIGGNKVLIAKRTVRMLSKANNVLWAATINAAGRIKMLGALENCGGSLIYCDTDSLMSISPIDCEGNDVGMLRDTGHFANGMFFGPKLYRLWTGDEIQSVHARGIPKQLALQFMEKGEISFAAPTGIIMGVRLGVAPTHWQLLSRTNRNRFGNRVIFGATKEALNHGWLDSDPPFVDMAPAVASGPRSRLSVSR